MDKNEEILEQTVRYFKEKQDRYGATVKGLDWNSKEAQNIRFQQLEKRSEERRVGKECRL